eukprot:gb/GECG01014706.1/.p1 GENE.gb/GECG01014706.1/~~gb/GECG01014706.1/.p1  ORF type:complete len:115 (+),score=9.66 gb/GECG01014706.1/:1-345(+)
MNSLRYMEPITGLINCTVLFLLSFGIQFSFVTFLRGIGNGAKFASALSRENQFLAYVGKFCVVVQQNLSPLFGELTDVKFNYTHVILTAVVLALVMVVEAVHTCLKEESKTRKN